MYRLTTITGEMGGGEWLKKDEGISQRTYMNDPWTKTTVWELTMVVGELGGGGAKGEKLGQL